MVVGEIELKNRNCIDVRTQVANFTVKLYPIFLFLDVEINIHSIFDLQCPKAYI